MKKTLTPFSALARSLKQGGTYKHYSGKTYQVLGVGRHSETLDEYVIYKALYGEGDLWMRPLTMFLETIEIEGKIVPRFALLT